MGEGKWLEAYESWLELESVLSPSSSPGPTNAGSWPSSGVDKDFLLESRERSLDALMDDQIPMCEVWGLSFPLDLDLNTGNLLEEELPNTS